MEPPGSAHHLSVDSPPSLLSTYHEFDHVGMGVIAAQNAEDRDFAQRPQLQGVVILVRLENLKCELISCSSVAWRKDKCNARREHTPATSDQ